MQLGNLTLGQLYELYICALLGDQSARTIAEYRYTLIAWQRVVGDVGVADITPMHLAQFVADRRETLAAATINKHLRHLQTILDRCGQPGPRSRDALSIVDRVPWVRKLRTQSRLPRTINLTEISEVYRAAPDGHWRALLVLAYNLGLRLGVLLTLTWPDVQIGTRVLRVRPEYDKRHQERRKPLNEHVRRHLVEIRKPTGLVLDLPRRRMTLYRRWHVMLDRASIADHWTPHDLKRTCGTQLAKSGASEWAVRYMLDHAQRDVTGQSYIDPLDELRGVVDRIPQPAAFYTEVKLC